MEALSRYEIGLILTVKIDSKGMMRRTRGYRVRSTGGCDRRRGSVTTQLYGGWYWHQTHGEDNWINERKRGHRWSESQEKQTHNGGTRHRGGVRGLIGVDSQSLGGRSVACFSDILLWLLKEWGPRKWYLKRGCLRLLTIKMNHGFEDADYDEHWRTIR